MPLSFVFDENLRGVPFTAVQRHNARGRDLIDAVRVGDLIDLPLGTQDPELLLWAEASDRILATYDENTMPAHLRRHLAAGHHSPGVIIPRNIPVPALVEYLVYIAHASEPADWADRALYVP